MSFDVFVYCLDASQPWGIPRPELRALFPLLEAASQPDYWVIEYDPLNRCAMALTPLPGASDAITSLHIERPCGELRFWDALFQLLGRGPVVLFFPGGPPLVANPKSAAALAASPLASLGAPRVVASAAEILAVVQSS